MFNDETQCMDAGLDQSIADDDGGACDEGGPDDFVDDLNRRFRRPLARYFEKRIREQYDVDDLVQEVFIRLVYRNVPERIDRLEGYVFQTAANVIRDRLRRQAARCHAEHAPLDEADLPPDLLSPERILHDRQLLERAIAALQELAPRTRRIFVLRRHENMGHDEIARRMGMTVHGVRFHLLRAKMHLALRMQADA